MSWTEFHHEAMATTFALYLAGHPTDYLRQAAAAAWRELDRLERELSRFIETSDISRANRLARGESLIVGDDCLQCLLVAAGAAVATGGAFNAAYASQDDAPADPARPPFTLDPETHRLTAHVQRLRLDLGAVGKGYSLDVMGAVLEEWDIVRACLQSGGSTAFARQRPPDRLGWPIGLGEDPHVRVLELEHAALSGSGTAVKGDHLIDPRSQAIAARTKRTWALAPTAAWSDALSTAFFVWNDEEIARFCAVNPEVGGASMQADGSLACWGALAR